MSGSWLPQQRKFCKFCNCWYADNKISIESHERGATHQANVDRSLNDIRKNNQDMATAERVFMAEMQKIEAAALRSFEEDAKRDTFAKNEMERLMQAKSKSNR